MQVSTIGLDLAKQVFQVHGVDAEGAVGSCPVTWCRSEAPEQRWLRGQAVITGRLTVAVSLTEPRVSRLM